MKDLTELPYNIKEIINLYCLNKISDYNTIQTFNKICNYEPCAYSNIKIWKVKKQYTHNQTKHKDAINKLVSIASIKKENMFRAECGNSIYMKSSFFNNDLFGFACHECGDRYFTLYKRIDQFICAGCAHEKTLNICKLYNYEEIKLIKKKMQDEEAQYLNRMLGTSFLGLGR